MAGAMEKRLDRSIEPEREPLFPPVMNFPTTPQAGAVETGALFRLLLSDRADQEPLALATVISRTGSAPRRPGAAMLVNAGGAVAGSVGGGALEAQVIATARQAIRAGCSCCRVFTLTAPQAAADGMICGGRLEVLIDYLGDAGDPRREIMVTALRLLAAGRDCRLAYSLRPHRRDHEVVSADITSSTRKAAKSGRKPDIGTAGGAPVTVGCGLLVGDEFVAGTIDAFGSDPEALAAKIRRAGRLPSAVLITADDQGRYFLPPRTMPATVVIAGAGHIARALTPLCRFAGFQTVVIDDRPEFACRKSFPDADRIMVAPAFANCFQDLPPGTELYIVIVTRGHLCDGEVLAQALTTGAAYIGMIGSRKKREAVYRQLAGAGCSPEALARVHCPIGLAIGAQTPAEIAVSIVAELIACRHANRQAN